MSDSGRVSKLNFREEQLLNLKFDIPINNGKSPIITQRQSLVGLFCVNALQSIPF